MPKNYTNGSMDSVVYKLVLEAARKVDGDEGATICQMHTYIRENGCVQLNDRELGTAIRDALKQGIQEGVLKQDYCTKKYYAVTPAKIERSKKPCARKPCSCEKQKTTDSYSACEEDDDEDDDFSCCTTCSSSDSDDCD